MLEFPYIYASLIVEVFGKFPFLKLLISIRSKYISRSLWESIGLSYYLRLISYVISSFSMLKISWSFRKVYDRASSNETICLNLSNY